MNPLARRVAYVFFAFALTASGCGSEVANGSGGGGAGGSGGADPCAQCDQLCGISGCEVPEYTCFPVNGACDGPPAGPACGCDGQTVEDDYGGCALARDRLPMAPRELCQTGSFACGDQSCTRNAEICVVSSGGPVANPSYECVPIESVNGFCSGIPDCACMDLTSLGCGNACDCSADADHQETVVINLP